MHKLFGFLFALMFAINCSGPMETKEELEKLWSPPAKSLQKENSSAKKKPSRSIKKSPCPPLLKPDISSGQMLHVTKVSDGDTIEGCLLPQNIYGAIIRVAGIDCPESKANSKCHKDERKGFLGCDEQVPLGQIAKNVAESRLLNRTIKLEPPRKNKKFKQDVFGRTLSFIRLENGEDYGLEMIRRGYCNARNFGSKHLRHGLYEEVQSATKK